MLILAGVRVRFYSRRLQFLLGSAGGRLELKGRKKRKKSKSVGLKPSSNERHFGPPVELGAENESVRT